jgi:hypothetical protein
MRPASMLGMMIFTPFRNALHEPGGLLPERGRRTSRYRHLWPLVYPATNRFRRNVQRLSP